MGVTGLWSVLESVGHPVKLDGLEGKRLGVDANIWLYKFIRGFREKDNTSSLESHKLGLFNRISKLLFYKIKPVFVFDGPAPVLKRRTLERRQNVRNKQIEKVQDAAVKLLVEQLKGQYPDAQIADLKIKMPELRSNNLVAAEKLGDEDRELFTLPPMEEAVGTDSDDDYDGPTYIAGASSVDIHSKDFKQMPPEIRYEILKDMKEARKRHRRSELPDDAESFSNTQLQRLKARRSIQEKIEECEKEICFTYTGQSFRMQSDSSTFLLLTNSKQQQEQQKQLLELAQQAQFGVKQETKPGLEVKQSYSQLSAQPSESETADLKIKMPELRSNNLVAAEKLSDEDRELFTLPQMEEAVGTDSDDDYDGPTYIAGASSVDIHSKDFKQMPPEIRYEILKDMNETRKRHRSELPDDAESFSNTQLQRLKARRLIQEKIEECEKEICPTYTDQSLRVQSDSSNSLEQIEKDKDATELKSAGEKLSDEDYEIFTPSPMIETVDIDSDEDSGDSSTQSIQRQEPVAQSLPQDQHHSQQSAQPSQSSSSSSTEPNLKLRTPERHQNVGHTQTAAELSPAGEKPGGEARKLFTPPTVIEIVDIDSDEDSDGLTTRLRQQQESVAQLIQREQPQSQQFTQPSQSSSSSSTAHNVVTSKIVEEAKELLKLFGVPYIDAAGEAEAQCALLEKMELTDGTITDDSDIWLFGAQKVYRHFFSDDKYVMEYKMPDIEFHIRMNRDNLVCFAMLVGSDYTDGIAGVGPVTALEILSEFPGESLEPLVKFKRWREKCKATKDRIPGNKKRKGLLKFNLPDEFPSQTVFDGYLKPMADMSNESFTWGIPELDELREYARRNFAWDPKKTDDKILPVLKKLNERRTQTTIDSFFFKTAANRNPELFRSKRVNLALDKIAKKSSQQQTDEVVLTDESDED